MPTLTIDTGKAIRYGWESIQKDFWYLVGIAVVSAIVSGLANSRDTDPNGWSAPNGWGLLGIALSAWMTAGYTVLLLSYQRGTKLPFADLFTQFRYFWRVLGGTLLVGLLVIVGLVFLIVPGVYLALRLQFTTLLIVDRNLGILDAMRESARLSKGIALQLLGFDLTLLGVLLLGALALGVGVFVAMPIVWLAGIVVYRQVSGAVQSAPSPTPA